jgi:hypothetical protein
MWKHIGKNPEYVMVGDSEESRRGKQVREPLVFTLMATWHSVYKHLVYRHFVYRHLVHQQMAISSMPVMP